MNGDRQKEQGEELGGLVKRLADDLYIRPPRNPPHEKDAAEGTRGCDRALARKGNDRSGGRGGRR